MFFNQAESLITLFIGRTWTWNYCTLLDSNHALQTSGIELSLKLDWYTRSCRFFLSSESQY